MARIGLIGVGDMGSGLARNLMAAGHELTLYDVRPKQLQPFVDDGARAASTPRELGEHADFVMVMNGAQIMAVISGEDGLIAGLQPRSTFICTATIERSELEAAAEILKDADIDVVDAPVSGGAPGAAAGTLTMMVAAESSVFEKRVRSSMRSGVTSFTSGKRSGSVRLSKPRSPCSSVSRTQASSRPSRSVSKQASHQRHCIASSPPVSLEVSSSKTRRRTSWSGTSPGRAESVRCTRIWVSPATSPGNTASPSFPETQPPSCFKPESA